MHGTKISNTMVVFFFLLAFASATESKSLAPHKTSDFEGILHGAVGLLSNPKEVALALAILIPAKIFTIIIPPKFLNDIELDDPAALLMAKIFVMLPVIAMLPIWDPTSGGPSWSNPLDVQKRFSIGNVAAIVGFLWIMDFVFIRFLARHPSFVALIGWAITGSALGEWNDRWTLPFRAPILASYVMRFLSVSTDLTTPSLSEILESYSVVAPAVAFAVWTVTTNPESTSTKEAHFTASGALEMALVTDFMRWNQGSESITSNGKAGPLLWLAMICRLHNRPYRKAAKAYDKNEKALSEVAKEDTDRLFLTSLIAGGVFTGFTLIFVESVPNLSMFYIFYIVFAVVGYGFSKAFSFTSDFVLVASKYLGFFTKYAMIPVISACLWSGRNVGFYVLSLAAFAGYSVLVYLPNRELIVATAKGLWKWACEAGLLFWKTCNEKGIEPVKKFADKVANALDKMVSWIMRKEMNQAESRDENEFEIEMNQAESRDENEFE